MIDAYEIGIQLLLQDDVSAGLAVINRELAEVDRAIAVASAGLVGLAHEAGRATTAVSAGISQHAPTTLKAEEEHPETSSEQSAQEAPAISVITPVAVTDGEKPAAPAMRAAHRPAQEAEATASPLREGEMLQQQSGPGQALGSSAPVAGNSVERARPFQQPEQPIAEAETYRSVAPAAPAPAMAQPPEPGPLATREVVSVAPDARPASTVPSAQMAFTSSISRARRPEVPGQRAEPVGRRDRGSPAAERQHPTALWSGAAQVAPRSDVAGMPPRASAPKAPEQGSNGAGDGTVMLDGRLVGQWLSEHMGREASRPPAGTSFFDPRQTPAWTVSGAL